MDTFLSPDAARSFHLCSPASPYDRRNFPSIAIVGPCGAVAESLALLVNVRRGKHMSVAPICRWYANMSWCMPDVLIVDVQHELPPARWFLNSLRDGPARPYTIVMAWPTQESIGCLADSFIEKPYVLPALLEALDAFEPNADSVSQAAGSERDTLLPGGCEMTENTIILGRRRYRISAIPSSRGGWTMRVECEARGTVTSAGHPIDIAIEFSSEQDVFDSANCIVKEMDQRRVATA